MENFTVIIVDAYTIEITTKYISHLRKKVPDELNLHVVLVDNAENSQGLIWLEKEYVLRDISQFNNKNNVYRYERENITLLYYATNENMGYAKGNNIGTEIADIFFSDPFYLISNNDIHLSSIIPWSDIKKIFDENIDIAVLGPKIINLHGKTQSPGKKMKDKYWLFYRPWHSLVLSPFIKGIDDIDYDNTSKRVYRLMGSFMFVKREPFVKVGRFDKETFLYFEEPILSEKLMQIGCSNYFFNGYEVVHEHGLTTGKLKKRVNNARVFIDAEFESSIHYCTNYLNTPSIIIVLAKINKYIRNPLYKIKDWMKCIVKYGE